MRYILALAAALAVASPSPTQDEYWVANRRTDEIHAIDAGGATLRSIQLSANLRSAHLAPDGKVWVVRFSQSTFDVVDPDTGSILPVVNPSGNVYSITFDRAGHAWVSGGTAVEEYDANGNYLASYPLATSAPLTITIDNQGNKWVAHRVNPNPSISRIDGVTGLVTNHVIPVTTSMMPVRLVADYRGFSSGLNSHIWVTGDSSGDMAEFDDQGSFVALHQFGASSLSGITTDLNGHIWVCNRSGLLWQIDSAGTVLNSYAIGAVDALDLSTDYEGRIWMTDRVTFSCGTPPCAPCEMLRINPTNGVVEVPAIVGIGTQSRLATQFHHATVVDPFGDLDGDTVANISEIINGTSPSDPASSLTSVITTRSSEITQILSINHRSVGATTSSIMMSATATAPLTIPGFQGDLLLGLPLILAFPVSANGYSINLVVPNDINLHGVVLFVQNLVISPTLGFGNLSSIRIWR